MPQYNADQGQQYSTNEEVQNVEQNNTQNQDSNLDEQQEDNEGNDGGQNDQDFQQFQQKYSRKYDPEQKDLRYNIFQNNKRKIKQYKSQGKSYQLEQNQFSDLSLQQFQQKYLMQDLPQMPIILSTPMSAPPDFEFSPIDWRDSMNPAKHQGKCGSCYAFSVTGVMETMIKLQTQQEVQLSNQQIVDCCKSGCNGCRGGWPVSALEFISKQGISLERDYPYVSQLQDCQAAPTINFLQAQFPFSKVSNIDALLYALQSGPVSVIMDASTWEPLYKSGVFDQCPQKPKYNHAVICVGVDEEGVWIVRNSWGINWGDQGHIYLPSGNSCGIADMGLIPNFESYDLGLGMMPPDQ